MKHFAISEFKCGCCGMAQMDRDFLDRLDRARGLAAIPFTVTSGYRCKAHNKSVGGSVTSSHVKGLAADIHCTTAADRYLIINALLNAGFTRMGIGPDFIHVDDDRDKTPGVIWLYSGD